MSSAATATTDTTKSTMFIDLTGSGGGGGGEEEVTVRFKTVFNMFVGDSVEDGEHKGKKLVGNNGVFPEGITVPKTMSW